MGEATSMAAFILATGTKGKRYALPHARILIHQPMSEFWGQTSDIDLHAREIMRSRDELASLMAKHTGQPLERVRIDTERDYFMTAAAAEAYGLIDEVIGASDSGGPSRTPTALPSPKNHAA
jgi:ATP-dependent Clp protease protease subunit